MPALCECVSRNPPRNILTEEFSNYGVVTDVFLKPGCESGRSLSELQSCGRFGVLGLGFGVECLGFGVWGLGFWV